ncbi:MAG: hypothetical protein VX300_01680, partial [Acidobacteriota bacterium]|nr:hypothetical protein [Acidobacteriota bacterium]
MDKHPHLGSQGTLLLLFLAILLFTACSDVEPVESVQSEIEASEPEFLYVASQSGPALSVIDMNAREVVETI